MVAFVVIVQSLVAISVIGMVLMQRSEGGGLGVGGSSSGFMTARGAADFLTRSTAVLGGIFLVLSIVMAALAGGSPQGPTLESSPAHQVASSRPAPEPQQPDATPAAPANQPAPALPP